MMFTSEIKKAGLLFCFCFIFLLVVFSCTKDKSVLKTNSPIASCQSTYCLEIQAILNLKCALSGCHVGSFPFGNFSSYGDLKARIDNGKLNKLVFEYGLMPPANAVKLNDAELKALKSWLDDGAKEN